MPCWKIEFSLVLHMSRSAHCTITMLTKNPDWQVYSSCFRWLKPCREKCGCEPTTSHNMKLNYGQIRFQLHSPYTKQTNIYIIITIIINDCICDCKSDESSHSCNQSFFAMRHCLLSLASILSSRSFFFRSECAKACFSEVSSQ